MLFMFPDLCLNGETKSMQRGYRRGVLAQWFAGGNKDTMEKLRFGVPFEEICKPNIPASLLVLILKINAEGPHKKEVFRAPGNYNNVKQLMRMLRSGKSVNLQDYSVHTVASLLKKFLQKLPDGIFGAPNEDKLFRVMASSISSHEKVKEVSKIVLALPGMTQKLLVLLIGMFKLIAVNADDAGTGMSSEALGVSVAPSILHSCTANGKKVDVDRFRQAASIVTFLIDQFGSPVLFGRDNYEYFSQTTRQLFDSDSHWQLLLQCPQTLEAGDGHHDSSLAVETTLTSIEYSLEDTPETSKSHESLDTLAVGGRKSGRSSISGSSATLEARSLSRKGSRFSQMRAASVDELKVEPKRTESSRSLHLLDLQERQAARMRARSEWFLAPPRRVEISVDMLKRIEEILESMEQNLGIYISKPLSEQSSFRFPHRSEPAPSGLSPLLQKDDHSHSDDAFQESHSGYVSQSDDALDRGTCDRAGSHDSDRLGITLEGMDSGMASQSDDGGLCATHSPGVTFLEGEDTGLVSAETLSDSELLEESCDTGSSSGTVERIRNIDAETPT